MLQLKPERFDLAEVMAQPVSVCGRQFVADNSGALYWPSQSTLLVAELPLERRPAGLNGGSDGTGPDLRQALVRLAEVMDRYEPARVIALGDIPRSAASGPAAEEAEIVRILQEDREWVWIGAQADAAAAARLGGAACAELEISGLRLRHRPTPGWATHEIAASLRPAARLSMYGYTMRRACLVGNGRRLVMPAFAAPMSGRNVLDEAFRPLFGSGGMSVWMLGYEGLYPVATRLLAGD
jgi:metallophosphoesterase superfamily enzyme